MAVTKLKLPEPQEVDLGTALRDAYLCAVAADAGAKEAKVTVMGTLRRLAREVEAKSPGFLAVRMSSGLGASAALVFGSKDAAILELGEEVWKMMVTSIGGWRTLWARVKDELYPGAGSPSRSKDLLTRLKGKRLESIQSLTSGCISELKSRGLGEDAVIAMVREAFARE